MRTKLVGEREEMEREKILSRSSQSAFHPVFLHSALPAVQFTCTVTS